MIWPGLGVSGTVGVIVALAVACLAAWLVVRSVIALSELARGIDSLGAGKHVRPIRSRARGLVGRLIQTFNIVAAQVEERHTRQEQEIQQLRAVLSGMTEAVIAVDGRQRLMFANESANRLFALDASSVGRLVAELIRNPRVQEAVEKTLDGPGPYRGEITLLNRYPFDPNPPSVVSVLGSLLPRALGSPARAVLVFHDVTELRRLERMRQDFVANVSHELKTPLASIKAYTETLLDWALHDEKVNVRFLRQIAEQADRLDRLVLDLLILARLESGQEVYRHYPLALRPVVHACFEAHRGHAEAKGLDYRIDLTPLDDSSLIRADEEAIREILDNLFDNAVKYTPESGSVSVSCQFTADDVVLDVADTGIGIPRDDLPRVFERFYRVDRARSRELGGTGLGLSIVKHLVQSLGGEVSVTSRVGAGSKFTVRLPRLREPEPEQKSTIP